jgi:hypothetical protein
VLCYQYGGESSNQLEPSGSPANWRCMNVEKFSRVELVDDTWHTAPNHSRPQTCVTDVDVDIENYPDGIPHSGQRGRQVTSWRAITARIVVIERGLCRSGRRRTAGPEAGRKFGS